MLVIKEKSWKKILDKNVWKCHEKLSKLGKSNQKNEYSYTLY